MLAGRQRLSAARVDMLEAEKIVAMGRHSALQVQTPAAKPVALDNDAATGLGIGNGELRGDNVR
jgi:hypothetical protein